MFKERLEGELQKILKSGFLYKKVLFLCDKHISSRFITQFTNEFNLARSPFKLKYFLGEEHFYDELDCNLVVSLGSGKQTAFARRLAERYKFPLFIFPSAPTCDTYFKGEGEVIVVEEIISACPASACELGSLYLSQHLLTLYEDKIKKYLFGKGEEHLELENIVYASLSLAPKLDLAYAKLELMDLLFKLSKLKKSEISLKQNFAYSLKENYLFNLKSNFNSYINFFENKKIDENIVEKIKNSENNKILNDFLNKNSLKREFFLKLNAEKNKLLTSARYYLSLVENLERAVLGQEEAVKKSV